MRLSICLVALGFALMPASSFAQSATPSGAAGSSVVGPTGPVYVPDPAPVAPARNDKPSASDDHASNQNAHPGHRRRQGGAWGGSGSGTGSSGSNGLSQ